MSNLIHRTPSALIKGAAIGNLCSTNPQTVYLNMMFEVCRSIKEKNTIVPSDIQERLSNYNDVNDTNNLIEANGGILVAIAPLVFSNIYSLSLIDLEQITKDTISVLTDDKSIILCGIEFIYLLHDILYNVFSKDKVLKILPGLDISESEVVVSDDSRDVFFSALWSFIFSDDFVSAMQRANSLQGSNAYVSMVTGIIAGLYYGEESMSQDMKKTISKHYEIEKYIF